MSEKRPTAEQMAIFKKNANDQSLSAEVRAKFKAIVDKFENVTEKVGAEVVKDVESKKRGRKPATAKPKATKKTTTDIEKAKAEIKAKTGKTEEECEAIIEQYRALRTKAQEGKRKAEKASAENKKRVEKLEDKGDLIEGTNVKTADAVIESTAKDVAEKIEQQIEAVEDKAEKEAKAEVAKDKSIKTPKAKKEAVEAKVEKKVKEKTKVVVQRVVIDTSALLTSIATTLGKFDKDSQKEFLIKLRSDIDKLLAKYAFGGMTDGATQVMNIQQSNLSASSVNPTLFAHGGGVGTKGRYHILGILKGKKPLLYAKTDDKKEISKLVKQAEKDFFDLTGKKHTIFVTDSVTDDEVYHYAKGGRMYANGGGIYSSDELYIVKVFDLNGNLLDSSKRVWARNLSKAKEIAIDDFEYDMQQKYGTDLRFKVEEAPSMFANGGGVASRTKVEVGDEKIAIIKNRKEVKGYPVYVTSQGYAPITIGVYETKEKAEQKAMQIRKKNKYEVGGVIGQEIVFDDNGEENTGVIKDITNLGDYVVRADDGRTLLAQRELDVISLGAMRQQGIEQRKKRFGFFDEGGNVSDLDYSDILAVLEDKLTDSIQELPNDFENAYNAEGEEVEHQSRDGFIAFTDGGYEIRWFETLSGFWGAGYALPTKALDKEKDRQINLSLEDAKDYFKGEYPEIVEELGEENIDYHSLYEAGYESEAEELSEVEMDMMDGTIMCEIGAYYYSPSNDRGIEGQHTLRLFGLVNLESPYHRSGNLEDRYDIDITFDSIDELAEKVDEGLKEIIDWFNGSHYFKSTEQLRIRRMAKGGLTEHGLRVGDKITRDFRETFPKSNEIGVLDEDNVKRVVNLDRGTRMAKGGNVSSMLRNRRGM